MAPNSIGLTSENWPAGDVRIPALVSSWTGRHSWSWSAPLPACRRIGVVTSRLPRLLDPAGAWLNGLRAAIRRIRDCAGMVVVARSAAGSELILRAAARLGVPAIELDGAVNPKRPCRSAYSTVRPHPGVIEACAGPDENTDGRDPITSHGLEIPPELARVPLRDRACVAWSEEIIVLACRYGGNLHTLLEHRLMLEPVPVVLVGEPELQSPRVRQSLLARGAQLWTPHDTERFPGAGGNAPARAVGASPPTDLTRELAVPRGNTESVDERASRNVASSALAALAQCLTHTTRARVGPWPGQSIHDHFDSLLEASDDAYRSPLATLRRIVLDRRLIASSQVIRGGYRVVSFTEVPLEELPALHVFRPHRSRWDFCPFGISIRRSWLERRGARPVLYGNDDLWKTLSECDRPFFQLVGRGHAAPHDHPARHATDWTVEREWRTVGDVDLADLSPADALLFVPTDEAAGQLASISPWPVYVLPPSTLGASAT